MKKPYQIEAQRAVNQLEAIANDGNPAVQMMLPMAEMVGWLRKGVGELVRQAGLQLMDLLMQEEVRELVGEMSQRQAERSANHWGERAGLLRGDEAEGAGSGVVGIRGLLPAIITARIFRKEMSYSRFRCELCGGHAGRVEVDADRS